MYFLNCFFIFPFIIYYFITLKSFIILYIFLKQQLFKTNTSFKLKQQSDKISYKRNIFRKVRYSIQPQNLKVIIVVMKMSNDV